MGPSVKVKAAVLGVGLVLPEPQPTMLPAVKGAPVPGYACSELPDAGPVPARALRRLGRTQRLALGAAHRAMEDCGGVPDPESVAVSLGTGLGTLDETAAFLENLVEGEEREPKPARFINSVHNAAAAQTAMAFGFRGENDTFVHESISFELALWQGCRLIETGRSRHVLAIGADELNPYFLLAGREYGWWRKDSAPLAPMDEPGRQGTLPGEGAAAFLIGRPGSDPEGKPLPRIAGIRVRPLKEESVRNVNPADEVEFIRGLLADAGVRLGHIDLYLFGANGRAASDAAYADVGRALSEAAGGGIRCGVFKQRCGEFCAAPAIGLALAVYTVRTGHVAPEIQCRGPDGAGRPVSSVALYHLHETGYHSICLVTV